ncbi:hypothetical protein N7495_004770 [Penicillium taxi]|uniref:uncharacterized protein n=1 Tax=Penicillium taxi TaxID=168475 RepID=UPI002544F773|nr:uncharacterized protein N7495_004770 [Penicillium taxi]KAJ5900026.1 hypothetical protein N7495_004770 [Penicillium taxi]
MKQGHTPLTTSPPDPALVAGMLLQRADERATCGYINADISLSPTKTLLCCDTDVAKAPRLHAPEARHAPPMNPIKLVGAAIAWKDVWFRLPAMREVITTEDLYNECETIYWQEATLMTGFQCVPEPFVRVAFLSYSGEPGATLTTNYPSSDTTLTATSPSSTNSSPTDTSPTDTYSTGTSTSTHCSGCTSTVTPFQCKLPGGVAHTFAALNMSQSIKEAFLRSDAQITVAVHQPYIRVYKVTDFRGL